jgi:ATP-binding cassette, subfamily B, bacterial
MSHAASSSQTSWNQRRAALRNVPPVLRLVWDAAPAVVASGIALRLLSALIPVAMLAISKFIIDIVASRHSGAIPMQMWWLLAAEFLLASLNQLLRLADEFTREVSLRVIRHSTQLDLAAFEDPGFHDMLERARQQATDRIGMLNAMGRLLLQSITLISLSAGVVFYSPWVFLLLVICVVPAFIGESHFAFLGYALAHQITPVRREVDYAHHRHQQGKRQGSEAVRPGWAFA